MLREARPPRPGLVIPALQVPITRSFATSVDVGEIGHALWACTNDTGMTRFANGSTRAARALVESGASDDSCAGVSSRPGRSSLKSGAEVGQGWIPWRAS